MRSITHRRAVVTCIAVSAGLAAATVASPTDAQTAARQGPAVDAPAAPCDEWEFDYDLTGRVRLEDTPFGAGDGVYDVGPGRLVLHVTRGRGDRFTVEMREYRMRNHFTVRSKVLFWKAQVVTRAESSAGSGGPIARGYLSGRRLTWTTPIEAHRTDGTLHCSGSGCGQPGVPPEGTSALHIGPDTVRFAPFEFDESLDTFRMGFVRVSKTEQPKQTAYVSIAGRLAERTCG